VTLVLACYRQQHLLSNNSRIDRDRRASDYECSNTPFALIHACRLTRTESTLVFHCVVLFHIRDPARSYQAIIPPSFSLTLRHKQSARSWSAIRRVWHSIIRWPRQTVPPESQNSCFPQGTIVTTTAHYSDRGIPAARSTILQSHGLI
jgi:hypothetical protein